MMRTESVLPGESAMSMESDSIIQSLAFADDLGRQGRMDEMETICRAILAEFPGCSDAWNKLAIVAAGRNNGLQAVAYLERALAIAPSDPALYANLGEIWRRAGVPERAVEHCRRAVQCGPDNMSARVNLGFALLDAGQPEQALEQFTSLAEIHPGNAQILSGKARAHNALGQVAESATHTARLIELIPDNFEALLMHARTQFGLGDYDSAEKYARRALELQPGFPAAITTLTDSLMKKGGNDEAENVLRTALRTMPATPDLLYRLSLCCLSRGEYREGFALYETRLNFDTNNRIQFPVLPMPIWTGQPISGKRILVITEQGFGDHFQFCRFITRLAAAGAIPVVGVSPPLAEIMTTLSGCAEVLTEVVGARVSACDFWVFVGSLPNRLGVDTSSIGTAGPYLSANPQKRDFWRQKLAAFEGKKKIGLVWAGRPDNSVDALRSLQFDMLAPLARLPGITWVALQEGKRLEEARTLSGPLTMESFPEHISSFDDTAALMAELDLVISVDSAPAHLAGALGRPVWVLLPNVADWRWQLGEESSPWYPTARLFRQRTRGDWGDVVGRVVDALGSGR